MLTLPLLVVHSGPLEVVQRCIARLVVKPVGPNGTERHGETPFVGTGSLVHNVQAITLNDFLGGVLDLAAALLVGLLEEKL